MGLIRKAASMSTLGGVKYTSRREAQTKAAHAQARVANAEAKLLREQAKGERAERQEAEPWYRQPTLGAAIKAKAAQARKDSGS